MFVGSVTPDPNEVPTVEEEALELDSAATDSVDEDSSGGVSKKSEYPHGERRQAAKPPEAHRAIKFDDKGNAVLEWTIDTPRRRQEDDTIDLLECLDPDGLSLADDVDPPPNGRDAGSDGFNPYDKKTKNRKQSE